MATLTSILHLFKAEIPSATNAVLFQALSEATREFCRRSLAWQVDADSIDVEAEVSDYDIELDLEDSDSPEEDTEVVRIVKAVLDDRELKPGAEYVMNMARQFRFVTEPTAASTTGLVVTVALQPGPLRDYLADDIMLRFRHVIAAGARYWLFRQHGKPWSSMAEAGYWKGEFEAGITSAVFDDVRGLGTTADAMVEMRRFL